MGGSGARNRRRQHRHLYDEREDEAGGGGRVRQRPPPTSTSGVPSGLAPISESVPSGTQSWSESMKNTNKKTGKPKHLKRKLEALNVDDPSRQKILQAMHKWEEQKKCRRQAHPPGRTKIKKPRDTHQARASWTADVQPVHLKGESLQEFQRISDAEIANKDAGKNSTAAMAAVDSNNGIDDPRERRDESHSDTMNSTAIIGARKEEEESNSDESVKDDEMAPARQRGQRRRGRTDTSKKAQEETTTTKPPTNNDIAHSSCEKEPANQDGRPPTENVNDRRYCIGRKPVTDFVIGQTYPGKAVYVKPFGLFLDIGCHSDAFCHVSRLQDDYVETADDLYKEGDAVVARVVEVDRKKKRITVSLQWEARKSDEVKSVEARQERRQKRSRSRKAEKRTADEISPANGGPPETDRQVVCGDAAMTGLGTSSIPTAPGQSGEAEAKGLREVSATGGNPPRGDLNSSSSVVEARPRTPKPESEMTPQELRRARKLARRAARRAEREDA